MAVPSIRGVATTVTSFSASVVVPTVTSYAQNDILLVGICADVTVTTTPPSGFVLIQRAVDTGFGNDQILESYAKVAASSESGSFTFTLSSARDHAAFMVAIQGATASTTPHASAASTAIGGTAQINAPSVTTSVNDCLIVALYGVDNSPAGTTTYNSDQMTEVVDTAITSWASIAMYTTTRAASGGVSTYAATSNPAGANGRLMQMIAFAPGGPPQILTQPHDLAVRFSSSAAFTVEASSATGATLSYQWTENAANVGTNASSYTTTQTLPADQNARFAVSVWDTNGTTQSDNAYLRLTFSSGAYALEITTSDRYQLQDGTGNYLIEPWGEAATSSTYGPFFVGPLNGLGVGGRFHKNRLH